MHKKKSKKKSSKVVYFYYTIASALMLIGFFWTMSSIASSYLGFVEEVSSKDFTMRSVDDVFSEKAFIDPNQGHSSFPFFPVFLFILGAFAFLYTSKRYVWR